MQNRQEEETSSPLFKGATRPPEKLGIPYLSLLVVVCVTAALSIIIKSLYVPAIGCLVLFILWLVSKEDKKFIDQVILFLKSGGSITNFLLRKFGERYEPVRPKRNIKK